MIITLKDLKAKGACSSQVALFEATFGMNKASQLPATSRPQCASAT
jgi:hypothetical protein